MWKLRSALVVASLALVTLAGCADRSAGGDAPRFADSGAIGAWVDSNLITFDDVREVVGRESTVVLAEVAGVDQGHTYAASESYGTVEYRHAAVTLRVSRVFKGADSVAEDGSLVVSVPLGAALVDESGRDAEGSGPGWTTPTLAEVRRAIPVGSRFVVIGTPRPTTSELDLTHTGSVPKGASVLDGASAQLFVADPGEGRALAGWPDLTFEELLRRL